MNLIWLRLLFASCAWLFLAAAHAADKPGRFFASGQQKARDAKPHGPPPREMSRQLFESVEAGDSYATPEGPRKLRRLAGAIAVAADEKLSLAGYESDGRSPHGIRILRATDSEKRAQLGTPVKLNEKIRQLRGTATGRSVNPVFIDPRTGLRLLATTNLIVCLKPGVDARGAFGAAWSRVKPLKGTANQFLLALPGANADEIFAEVNRLSALPDVEWAEPDFIMQVRKSFTPNDPLFNDQWHLRNTGQLYGKSGADAKLTTAWDITRGNSNIVIAVIDDGVQMTHPDLAANIFINPGEIPGNGTDDDSNGFIDDVNGWDFYGNGTIGDNNPSPSDVDDNHGTALSGVAAGVGNNSLGISGAAPGCRIMPIKIIKGDDGLLTSELEGVLRYAGGLVGGSNSTWRGADVINISLTFSASSTINSALADVSARGRGGRGVPIFCASGNGAGAWRPVDVDFEEEGEYTLSWEFSKDATDIFSTGADTVWLDNVIFPDGSIEDFEGNGLPSGWVTGPTIQKGWTWVTSGVNGNRAMTGWDGPGSHALRAGRISDNEVSYLDFTTYLTPGRLTFWIWTESEAGVQGGEFVGFDAFEFVVNLTNVLANDFGVPILETAVGYPASNPNTIAVGASTDFDFRADYSQSGSALDFVAPSDGGLNGITTTDRTGGSGYNSSADYDFQFGGTSSSTPLASGIGALILSVNPFLTAAEIRTLMRSNCDKIGGETYDANGRNNHYGYGRVNAARSVSQARPELSVTLGITPALVLEGETSLYTITVSNAGPARSGPVTIRHTLPAGSAFASAQPGPASRVGNLLTFTNASLAARASAVFKVTVTNISNGANVSSVSVSNEVVEPSYANNDDDATTTVTPIPQLFISDATLTEGDAKSTNLVFTLSLSNPSARNVTVNYATASGTAVAGKDFASAKGSLRFLPGETSKTVAVRVLNERLDEDDETFFVNFSGITGAILSRALAIGTILDNDPLPALSVANKSRTEGNSGTAAMVFSVKLTPASGRPVSVRCSTAAGSAGEGSDFISTNGLLVFAPGKTLLTFSVPIVGDRADETIETFSLVLSDATNAVITAGTATGTIVDNDATPKLYLSDASVSEGDSDTTNLVFNVRLAPESGRPVSVFYFVTNGSATAGVDFAGTNATLLEFAPGVTNQTITVPVLGDMLSESNETIVVRLLAPTNATLGDATAVGTIIDDDLLPGLSIADATVGEPSAGGTNAVFAVTLSTASGRTIKVGYATSNLTARAGSDFTKKSGTLTFAPGVTNVPLKIAISRDTLPETNETFLVQLVSPVNATLDDAQGIGTILGSLTLFAAAGEAPLRLSVAAADAGRLRLSFPSVMGRLYVLEAKDTLADLASWQEIPGVAPLAGTGETLTIDLPIPPELSQRFYRLRLEE
jgi:uncharacterized repeat protein (TIGR01451 family)